MVRFPLPCLITGKSLKRLSGFLNNIQNKGWICWKAETCVPKVFFFLLNPKNNSKKSVLPKNMLDQDQWSQSSASIPDRPSASPSQGDQPSWKWSQARKVHLLLVVPKDNWTQTPSKTKGIHFCIREELLVWVLGVNFDYSKHYNRSSSWLHSGCLRRETAFYASLSY